MDTNCCWVGYVVYSNGSSSEGGQKGSSAVAVSRRGLSPTPRPANVAGDDGLSSSGGWGNINVECNTVPASTGQKIIVGGDVLEVKEPTPKTTAAAKATGTNNTQSPAAPAAVDNAVNAAGGTAPTATTANAVWVHAEGSSGHELRDGFRRISELSSPTRITWYRSSLEHWLSVDPAWRWRDNLSGFARHAIAHYSRPMTMRVERPQNRIGDNAIIDAPTASFGATTEDDDPFFAIDWDLDFPFSRSGSCFDDE